MECLERSRERGRERREEWSLLLINDGRFDRRLRLRELDGVVEQRALCAVVRRLSLTATLGHA